MKKLNELKWAEVQKVYETGVFDDLVHEEAAFISDGVLETDMDGLPAEDYALGGMCDFLKLKDDPDAAVEWAERIGIESIIHACKLWRASAEIYRKYYCGKHYFGDHSYTENADDLWYESKEEWWGNKTHELLKAAEIEILHFLKSVYDDRYDDYYRAEALTHLIEWGKLGDYLWDGEKVWNPETTTITLVTGYQPA